MTIIPVVPSKLQTPLPTMLGWRLSGGCGTHRQGRWGLHQLPLPQACTCKSWGSLAQLLEQEPAAAQGSAESPAAHVLELRLVCRNSKGSLLLAGERGVVRHHPGPQKYGVGGMIRCHNSRYTPPNHSPASVDGCSKLGSPPGQNRVLARGSRNSCQVSFLVPSTDCPLPPRLHTQPWWETQEASALPSQAHPTALVPAPCRDSFLARTLTQGFGGQILTTLPGTEVRMLLENPPERQQPHLHRKWATPRLGGGCCSWLSGAAHRPLSLVAHGHDLRQHCLIFRARHCGGSSKAGSPRRRKGSFPTLHAPGGQLMPGASSHFWWGTTHPPSVEAASSSRPLLPEEGTELQIQEREIGPWLLAACPPQVCGTMTVGTERGRKTGPKLGLRLLALP